ncbi:hypothetical protein RB195_024340 [Necator americanus]|uniref:Uncharacterized protein n=1 Tax=Necator americanus TaxID=51031 RepID=A0ABR1EMR2_NECAM
MESPPANKLHLSTQGGQTFFPKPVGLEACNLPMAPTSSYKEEEIEAFYMNLDRTIVDWKLFATSAGFWKDSADDSIDEEYNRLVEHLRDCTKSAESFQTTKRRLSLETFELIRQRGAA